MGQEASSSAFRPWVCTWSLYCWEAGKRDTEDTIHLVHLAVRLWGSYTRGLLAPHRGLCWAVSWVRLPFINEKTGPWRRFCVQHIWWGLESGPVCVLQHLAIISSVLSNPRTHHSQAWKGTCLRCNICKCATNPSNQINNIRVQHFENEKQSKIIFSKKSQF